MCDHNWLLWQQWWLFQILMSNHASNRVSPRLNTITCVSRQQLPFHYIFTSLINCRQPIFGCPTWRHSPHVFCVSENLKFQFVPRQIWRFRGILSWQVLAGIFQIIPAWYQTWHKVFPSGEGTMSKWKKGQEMWKSQLILHWLSCICNQFLFIICDFILFVSVFLSQFYRMFSVYLSSHWPAFDLLDQH